MLADAYREEEIEGDTRVVLALNPSIAPTKAAVFPLVKKDGMPEIAHKINDDLRASAIPSFYDQSGRSGVATVDRMRSARRGALRSTVSLLRTGR